MDYNIQPVPTWYNGINFRSRLEAKWAAFFDEMEWEWQYEPCQINGYNPDFIIKCNSHAYSAKTIIVEIKPYYLITKEYKDEVLKKYNNIKSHILILDEFPFCKSTDNDSLVKIGIGSQCLDDKEFNHSDIYCFEMKLIDYDFASIQMIWDGMIIGESERKDFMEYNSYQHKDLLLKWKKCINKTQFKVK